MADGRKNNGGARPGAGRKRKSDEVELLSLLLEAWPVEKRREALEQAATTAASGRGDALDALKLLLSYAYGKPIDRKEITGADGGPLKGYIVGSSPDDWSDDPPAE